jgi:amino acid transporter
MFFFLHHMGVEILGREFSPHGVVEHVLTFAALGFIVTTSALGTWTLFRKAREAARVQTRV